MTLAQHSAETFEWGSPPWLVRMGEHVLGGPIELDVCSSAYWNEHTVRAQKYFDLATNGLRQPWPVGRTWCNPPTGSVMPFFSRCVEAWESGSSVFWVGFALEQLRHIQKLGAMSPLFRRCILPERVSFMRGRVEGQPQAQLFGETRATCPPEEGDSPAHANYLLVMPRTLEQAERFDAAAMSHGGVPW